MKINKMGTTRIVLVFNSFVIKFPNVISCWQHFLAGLLANMRERDTWRWNSGVYETGRSHLLCPVIWASWGGWILIMAKAETYSWDEWENILIEGDCEDHRKYFPGDDKVVNYGVYDGRIVKIDYGGIDSI